MASARDHIYPADWRFGHRRSVFNGVETVKACNECNAILGDRNFDHPAERHEYVIQHLRIKYHLMTPFVYWDEAQLSELGPRLRARISKALATRRLAEDRVLYAKHVAALLRMDDEGPPEPEYKPAEAACGTMADL